MATVQFTGLASGIDSVELIDAIIEARQRSNDLRKTEIGRLEGENSALEELGTKFLALNDLIDDLRTVNGGGIKRTASSSDSAVATASAGSTASSSSFTVSATSLAKGGRASFDDTYSATTAALAPNASGTQTIGITVGTGSNLVSLEVDITSSTTVEEFVDNFNDLPDAPGVVFASAVNVGTSASPSYQVIFSSQDQGVDKGTIAFSINDAATGFGGNSDLQNRTIDQATNAEFSIGGINGSISRSSNLISDLVQGVTFNLLKGDGSSTTITVGNDSEGTADQIEEIVEKFNEIVTFVNENDILLVDEESNSDLNIFGALADTSIDDDFLSAFRIALSAASSENGDEVTSMAQLGVSTNRDGTLDFDRDDFIDALASDPVGVEETISSFADDTAGASGFITNFTKFDGFIDIAQDANKAEIEILNSAVDRLDRQLDDTRDRLNRTFARLERITGELQAAQSSLNSVLQGLA